ncbi:MAG: Uncharacterized protein FD161_2404 [Limisphaerales bacterium]|nr:MAG: Uncharacterized protein FD161_2404 [Limisphaerales bacterium]KAG0508737.1 MAG: Uncharacterized protein E1N63_2155 [Limisphaerales bacterium]TXT50387.1 MAG: Uncharacterized protein FD140_2458 [Limisphaerales bacterium]
MKAPLLIATTPALLWLAILVTTHAADPARTLLKSESFDRDPGWEALNNRVEPKRVPTVTQDFGWSATTFASKTPGEVGGLVTRSTKPASYGDKVAKTLNDKLTASGTFAMTKSSPGAGMFFGWFNSNQPGGGGRPMQSLGLDFDTEGGGGRLAVRLITSANRSCGTFITPYLPGKFRPTPIRKDGTRYHWTLDYDPQAAGGRGSFTFTMRSDTHTAQDYGPLPENSQREAQARFPNTTKFTVDLPEGYQQEGASFDRFGMMNMMKSGGTMTMHFADLQHDGKTENLARDPGWLGSGNRATYQDREQVGAHDFGFSAKTSHAGGAPGEVGGGFWRSGDYGYYADRIGPLSFDDRLEASGRVVLQVGAPDSDMFLGWFNSAVKEPYDAGHFLGVHIGGPTRVGHWFHPAFSTAKGTHGLAEGGPRLTPGKVFEWSFVYDPAANGGKGEVRVTLGKESVTLALKDGLRAQGGRFDRFGLFTSTIGGQLVRVWLDDLKYTAGRNAR